MCSMRSKKRRIWWRREGRGCKRGRGAPYPGQLSSTAQEGTYMLSFSQSSVPRLWRTGPHTPAMATTMASSSTESSRASCCRQETPWVSLDSLWPPPPYFMLLEDHHIADAFVLCIQSVSACGMHALISSVRAALQTSETHVWLESMKSLHMSCCRTK